MCRAGILYHDLPLFVPSDPYYGYQWGLKNTGQYGGTSGIDIKAEQAWNITKGNSNVKVAVIDGGFQVNHPDLNVYGTGYDASSSPSATPQTSFPTSSPSVIRSEHGTACAGIIGAKHNSIGVSGIAPESQLMSVSLHMDCVYVAYDDWGDSPARVANAFNWSWMNGASVISCSWGNYSPSSYIDNAINNALNNGRNGLGCIVVFAAGNQNNTISYPANSNSNLIVAGAISQCGTRKRSSNDPTDFSPNAVFPVSTDPLGVTCDTELDWGSNYGPQLDIMAPGVLIATTDLQAGVSGSGYNRTSSSPYNIPHKEHQGSLLTNADDFPNKDYEQTFGGTSAACPHVSGVAALVLSVNPALTRLQATDIIEQTAQKIGGYSYQNTAGRLNGKWHQEMGYGLLNAYEAVHRASPSTLTTISNQLYNANTNITACNLLLQNISVYNNSKLIVDDLQGYTAINGPFEVYAGSSLEIR